MASEAQIRANRENAKKAGRKKGSLSPKTLDRMKVAEQLRQKTLKVADILFEKQLSLVVGAQYLFRIDKEFIKTGVAKGGEQRGYYRNKKPVLVTDPNEMLEYLTELADNNGDISDDKDESASYYFLVARDPSNQAIDSMRDFTFGKTPVVHDHNINLPQPIYNRLSNGKQKELPPKKTKATIISADGKEEREVEQA